MLPLEVEVGGRYWMGFGETGKVLHDIGGGPMVSRLTYRDIHTNAGEIYGQVVEGNYFTKGFAGLGNALRGTLQDEDFEPYISPYSSTDSKQNGGSIGYVVIDGGAYFYKSPAFRAGVFAGYSYFDQSVSAFGCDQTATNPDVCVPSISDSTKVITQDNVWQGVRIGVNGEANFAGRWRLRAEGAVLPFVWLNGTDAHWLRICDTDGCFDGPIPEDGTGWGVQAEATLDYQLTDMFSVGVGGRYWHMETTGDTHFENHIVGESASPQPVDWSTDIFGLLVHASARF
jgi:hypothetical protein